MTQTSWWKLSNRTLLQLGFCVLFANSIEAQTNFETYKKQYPDYASHNANNDKLISELSNVIAEQQNWLTQYLSKGKMARKSMFYKITWYGIPLN